MMRPAVNLLWSLGRHGVGRTQQQLVSIRFLACQDLSGERSPVFGTEKIILERTKDGLLLELWNSNDVEETTKLFSEVWVQGSNPINKALQTSFDHHQNFAQVMVPAMYKDGEPVVLARQGATGELVAFAFAKNLHAAPFAQEEKAGMATIIQRYLQFLEWAHEPWFELLRKPVLDGNAQYQMCPKTEGTDIREHPCRSGDVFDSVFFGVRPDMESKGLGSKVLAWSWAVARHFGYTHALGVTVHKYSTPFAYSFTPIPKIKYADYVELDGTRLLESVTDPTYCILAHVEPNGWGNQAMMDALCPGHRDFAANYPQFRHRVAHWKDDLEEASEEISVP